MTTINQKDFETASVDSNTRNQSNETRVCHQCGIVYRHAKYEVPRTRIQTVAVSATGLKHLSVTGSWMTLCGRDVNYKAASQGSVTSD